MIRAFLSDRSYVRVAGVCLAAGVVAGGAVEDAAADAGSFTPLDGLGIPSPSAFLSSASGISADGSVVVGNFALGGNPRFPFVWTASTGMTQIGTFVGTGEGISGDGSTVVGQFRRPDGGINPSQAFRWTADDGVTFLGNLPGSPDNFNFAYGASFDGSVVVGHTRRPGTSGVAVEAFRWTEQGGMIGLGPLQPGTSASGASFARAVSADGEVIAGFGASPNAAPGSSEAFHWTSDSGFVASGFLPGHGTTSALGISPDGRFTVGVSASNQQVQAFRHDTQTGQMLGLGFMPFNPQSPFNPTSRGFDISADGTVVVGSGMGLVSNFEAMVWVEGTGARPLTDILINDLGVDLAGWRLESASGVSADGRTVVGTGINPSGQNQAWIAVIPEPATAGLLLPAGLLTLRRRRPQP